MPQPPVDNPNVCPQCGKVHWRKPVHSQCRGQGCDAILVQNPFDFWPEFSGNLMASFRVFTWSNGQWHHHFEPDPEVRARHGFAPYPDARLAKPPPEIMRFLDLETQRAMGVAPREAPRPPHSPSATRGAAGRSPRPSPRLIRRAAEAEDLCAEWIRWMGFPDASPTPPGADGGIDVIGTGAAGKVVAQVKFEAVPAGRPKLQELFGAGHALGAKVFVFVSSAGFSAQAQAWADQVDMALFEFELDGSLVPVNPAAERLFES